MPTMTSSPSVITCGDGTVDCIRRSAITELDTLEMGCPRQGSKCTFKILSIENLLTSQTKSDTGISLATSLYCPFPESVVSGADSNSSVITAEIGLSGVSELDRLLEVCLTKLHMGETGEFVINCSRSQSSLKCTLQIVSIDDSPELYQLESSQVEEIASRLKGEGVKLFTGGFIIDSFCKFSQALKYFFLLHPCTLEPQQKTLISTIQCNMASCHLKLDNWEDTIDLCNLVLKEDGDNIKALYRRGSAYIETQEFEKANADLLKGKQLDPNNQAIRSKLDVLNKKQKALDAKYATAMKKFFT